MLDYAGGRTEISEPARVAHGAGGSVRVILEDALCLATRRKWLILLIALAGAAAGLLFAKAFTPRYIATAQIYLDPRGLPGFEKEDIATRQDSTGFINFVETQARILTSQVVLDRVVAAEMLATDPEFVGGAFLARFLGRTSSSENEIERRANALRKLGERIVIRRPERTFIIEISATSNEPRKSARIANAVARAYIDVRSAMQSESARQATSVFTARLEALRERLIAAERQTEDYKAKNGFVGTRDQYVDEQSLKDLNQQSTYAHARLVAAQSRYEELRRARASGADLAALAANLNNATLTNLRSQQAEARQKFADLSAELGPRHPAVKNAAARSAEIRRLVDAELGRIGGSFRKDFDQARGLDEGLRRDVEQLRQKAVGSAQASVQLRDLEREVEASRNIYESFLARSRQSAESQRLDSTSTHIVTTAAPPNARSFPPSAALTTSAGFVFGLACGMALALWRERQNNTGTPTRKPNNPVPSEDSVKEFTITDATRFTIRHAVYSRKGIELTRLGIPIVNRFEGRSEIDAVAHSLLDLIDAGGKPPVIALAGCPPDDARTIMSVNLALALSSTGLNVALIDADTKGAILTSFIEDEADAYAEARGPYVETRDDILLALPAVGSEARHRPSTNRIMDELLRGDPRWIDAVLCDGVFEEQSTLEKIDWVIPILGAKSLDGEVLMRLPESLSPKIAMMLRFDHPDPWGELQIGARKIA